MKARDRLKMALNHKEPDRVPIDLGRIVTGITKVAHKNLRDHLGIVGDEVVFDITQQLVIPEEELLKRFAVDTRYVSDLPEEREDEQFDGLIYIDRWGVKRKRADLDTGGNYFDIIESPYETATLEDLKKADFPDPTNDKWVKETAAAARKLHDETDYGVIINIFASVFEFAWYIRGFKQFLMDILIDQKVACYLMDVMLDYYLTLFDDLLTEVGSYIEVVTVGDDIANQQGPTISPDIYRRLVKPRQKKLYDMIKSKTDAKLFYHSCGNCRSFIPDLIEIGVDIINPVQASANNMNPAELKQEYGDDIVFWGGIDTQKVLPFGTPDEVREEVKRRIDQLAPGGGYVFNSVHNLQSDVPPENIVALFETALEYGRH